MTEKRSLAEAFVAAQAKMESPKRTASNPHFKSKFAPLEECVRVSIPALNAEGIALSQPCVSTDDGRVGVRTVLIGHGEEMDLGTLLGNPPDDPQKVGSWLTYFRRYALTSALGLAADDDDDGNAAAPKPDAKPAAKSDASSEAQQRKIHIEASEAGVDDAKLKAMLKTRFGVTSTKDLTKSQASKVIEGLSEARAKKAEAKLDEKMAEMGAEKVEEYQPDYSDEPCPF